MAHGDRLVGVDGPRGRGSGCLIGGGLVLASAHVVPEEGARVSCFRPGRKGKRFATVVWRGTPRGRDDAALLRLDEDATGAPHWPASSTVPVRWGRLVTHQPGTECEAWGLPDVTQRPGEPPETGQYEGTVNPGDRFVGNRHVMVLKNAAPEPASGGGSPWAGLSGAAMFCGDLLTGVIAADLAGFAHTRLEAVPAYVLLHDPAFRKVLSRHGVETLLQPVEWWDLLEPDPLPPAAPLTSPAALLEAHRAVVPFRGRTKLLDDLVTWCGKPGLGVQLVHGPGGQGKTRLAHHLAARLDGRWSTAWLDPGAAKDRVGVFTDAAVPLLVVVDYAETRTDQVAALLEAAWRRPGFKPFKLLLLARTDGDWWAGLRRRSRHIRDALDVNAGTHALEPLEPLPRGQVKAYRQAVNCLAGALRRVEGLSTHDWHAAAAHLTASASNSVTGLGTDAVLTLHMLALADLLDTAGPKTSPAGTSAAPRGAARAGPPTVESRLLEHEEQYWEAAAQRHGRGLRFDTLLDALAALLLCGAVQAEQVDVVLRRVPSLAGQSADSLLGVRDWVAAVYPPTGAGVCGSLRPDRLAEAFLRKRLEAQPALAEQLVRGITEEQATRLLTLYTRAAAHPPYTGRFDAQLTGLCLRHPDVLGGAAIEVATQVERPDPLLDALVGLADDPATAPAELLRLADRLPRPTRRLTSFALKVMQRLVDWHRQRALEDPSRVADLAFQSRRLGTRLVDAGHTQQAYETARESLPLLRRLAQEDPQNFQTEFAACLQNLAVVLTSLGRLEEAVFPAHHAVRLYRRAARWDGGDSLPQLAVALDTVSHIEGDLGRSGEALAANKEAVALRRTLLDERGAAFRPDLAAALNNEANWLRQAGRPREALKAAREATRMYQALSQERPDAHLAHLAMASGTLSACLTSTGQYKQALTAAEKAGAIRRELAREQPEVFLPDLALSLNSLAISHDDLGNRDEALAAATEAVDIYTSLVARAPQAHRERLAMSLNTLAVQLGNAGRSPEAVTAARQAVDLYRNLAASNPRAYKADLAMALTNLADSLAETGATDEALKAARDAVTLYQPLATQYPQTHEPDLCGALNTYALILKATCQLEEALKGFDEAIRISRGLARSSPSAQPLRLLATALLNKAVCLSAMQQPQDALAAAEESISIFRGLMRGEEEAYAQLIVTPLHARRLLLVRLGRTDEALAALEETVRARGNIPAQNAAQRTTYVEELTLLGSQWVQRGRYGAAVEPLRLAVAHCRELVQEDAERHRLPLIEALLPLGTALTHTGLREEALSVAERAVTEAESLPQDHPLRRPALVWALCLSGLLRHYRGRPQAEENWRRAVDLCQRPDGSGGPHSWEELSLPGALAGLGSHLAQSGSPEQGLPLLKQAAHFAQRLKDTGPQVRDLRAGVLVLLGHHLVTDAADPSAGLVATQEALELYEELASEDPAVYKRDLAWTLAHHALRLAETRREEDGLRAAARSLSLTRRLAAEEPREYEMHLALSLYAHAEAGRCAGTPCEQELTHITEARRILHELGRDNPGLVAPYLHGAEQTYEGLCAEGKEGPLRDSASPL